MQINRIQQLSISCHLEVVRRLKNLREKILDRR